VVSSERGDSISVGFTVLVCMCIGVTERPERKKRDGPFLASRAFVANATMGVSVELHSFRSKRQKQAHHKLSQCSAHLHRKRTGA
jgi:hypothetical protein